MTTPMTDTTALQVLGLQVTFQQLDGKLLKAAYRKSARESHPDAAGGDEDRFKQVAEAAEYLQKRLSGEIPASRFEPPAQDQQPPRRPPPVWSKVSAADAADALRFDDILDDLRVKLAPKPLIEFLPHNEVLVTGIPPGGAVSFDMARGATVYDAQANIVECDRRIVGAEDPTGMGDLVDELRRRGGR